ncbi:acetyl/propionyl-CoA carboxylase alpha subunit [Haloactinomyces albus]|uniref:Acetyl/propionyl-CoA carboxylase alpha subunit n=1 Tax=Haloactinomyces albus TaxID=1352928 RepID=A0AAE3ZFK4_9ACTN|nr:acetyl/propionyl-CoA carboxylase alpha subunit [Haloactinomyces albus]
MTSVLIANRGEIAVRIIRAASCLGLRCIAVHSPEDRDALHVRLADEAHALAGEGTAAYLDGEQIAGIAQRSGCTLVHPGYGFLSEDAGFAELCAKTELAFVGPSPQQLELFGDKARSRALAEQHGVPVLAATSGATTLDEARQFLAGLGPDAGVMVKALAGGGGRGMRAVGDQADLPWSYERARSEAERAFGNGDVYVERLLARAKHVEVQVLGDGSGDVLHLWDRECTIQRRNQKLIEVSPSPTLPAETRRALISSALAMATATSYAGLGTFEFLVDADSPSSFHFIETNPRLQVEHTITEELTGIDLVMAQLELARGRSLRDQGLTQEGIPEPRGFAIQARVNLEELAPDGSARATAGTLATFEPPAGPGVRVDTAGYTGYRASGQFDSLLAKIITRSGQGDFATAAAKTERALAEFAVAGAGTNIGLLRAILHHPGFRDGTFTTGFVDDHLDSLLPAGTSHSPAAADASETVLTAAFGGTVVAVEVQAGTEVAAGAPAVVLEAMKMEHVLTAPAGGVIDDVLVSVGDTVGEGTDLVHLTPGDVAGSAVRHESTREPGEIRPDLAEVIERHETGLDAARPHAVQRRHRAGRRTARENIADLCDPDGFTEYGALAIAAQRQRRSLDDLIANTPADGMITGIGHINGDEAGQRDSRCVVMSYDYTVLAGTQGLLNHKKTDRMLELAHRKQLPVVLFAEGGGGRPGDTDTTAASGLDVPTFATMGRLSGLVPTVGIASGRCFAGNAALLGCCDTIIATRDATIGMGGPAMIEGGGLGQVAAEDVGPTSMQVPNGVIDLLVEDEAEAVEVTKKYLSYFQGSVSDWNCADQRELRHVIPENRVRVYDVRQAVELLADTDSVLELRREFGTGVITALVRVEGSPMGLIANNPAHLGGAIDSDAADKTARFLQLCQAHGLPVISLCDTPGFMVGPEAEQTATVRHFSRLFVTGANLTVPVFAVVLRKGYGLGAQAMCGGSFREPVATVAWPTGEIGGMGLEGAVRLGYRRELDAIEDPAARQRAFDELLAEQYAKGKATNAAAVFELDDVIDPAETRRWITTTLGQHDKPTSGGTPTRSVLDTW